MGWPVLHSAGGLPKLTALAVVPTSLLYTVIISTAPEKALLRREGWKWKMYFIFASCCYSGKGAGQDLPKQRLKNQCPRHKTTPCNPVPIPCLHYFGAGKKERDRKGLVMLHRVTGVIQLVACPRNMATAKKKWSQLNPVIALLSWQMPSLASSAQLSIT